MSSWIGRPGLSLGTLLARSSVRKAVARNGECVGGSADGGSTDGGGGGEQNGGK